MQKSVVESMKVEKAIDGRIEYHHQNKIKITFKVRDKRGFFISLVREEVNG